MAHDGHQLPLDVAEECQLRDGTRPFHAYHAQKGGQMVELSVGLDMYVVLVDTDPSAEGGLPEVARFCRD